MFRHSLFFLLAMALSASYANADTIAKPAPSFENPRKLVIQLSYPDKKRQTSVLNNISNLLKFYENNVRIALVVYGPAIDMALKNSEFKSRIESLALYDKKTCWHR